MRYLLSIALALPLACASAAAQQPDEGRQNTHPTVGQGLICDSLQQLHRFVDMRNQGRAVDEALRTVNEEAKNPMACGTVMAAYAPGQSVDKMKMRGEAVELVEITVIAVSDGTNWKKVAPTKQYAIRTEPGISI